MIWSRLQGRSLEFSIAAASAAAIFGILELSSWAPGQRAVAALEAQVAAQPRVRPSSAPLTDQGASRRLCDGSAARAIGELERSAPRRARDVGIDNLQAQFGPPTAQGAFVVAPATLSFETSTPRLGDQLASLTTIAPSVFLDHVEISPKGGGQDAIVRITGRLACARP